ncbi:MAG TPA: hypothetical protein VF867_17845 [Arthrobacter sp.]
MPPIGTATALGNGPFNGFVPEALTTLFELSIRGLESVVHVVVSNLPEDDGFEAETSIFAVEPDGSLDIDFYLKNDGPLLELAGDLDARGVIEALGYEILA